MTSEKTPQLKIALVIPWFGEELKGGAEQQAWQIATRLKQAGVRMTVLTTCSKSFHDSWDINFYPPGNEQLDGIVVKRFAVEKRDHVRFNQVVGKLLALTKEELVCGVNPVSLDEEKDYLEENIRSPSLLKYLELHKDTYDAFLFLPYLFPAIIKGVTLVAEKAFLQPCLHDECYAYLSSVAEMFAATNKILFNSRGELQLAKNLYGEWIEYKAIVIGEGVEQETFDTENLPQLVKGKYLLSLGKRCPEKNTDLLITMFDEYIKETKSPLKLVLAGSGVLTQKTNPNVLDVGIVSEETKANLIKYCTGLANLSVNESFSRVVFEAWFAKKLVLVHKECLATNTALEDSKRAGWAIACQEDFTSACDELLKISSEAYESKARSGFEFAQNFANWDTVIARYVAIFSEIRPLRTSLKVYLLYKKLESALEQKDFAGLKEYCASLKIETTLLFVDESSASPIWDKDDTKAVLIFYGQAISPKERLIIEKFPGKRVWRTPFLVQDPFTSGKDLFSESWLCTEKEVKSANFTSRLMRPFLSLTSMDPATFNWEFFSNCNKDQVNIFLHAPLSAHKAHFQDFLKSVSADLFPVPVHIYFTDETLKTDIRADKASGWKCHLTSTQVLPELLTLCDLIVHYIGDLSSQMLAVSSWYHGLPTIYINLEEKEFSNHIDKFQDGGLSLGKITHIQLSESIKNVLQVPLLSMRTREEGQKCLKDLLRGNRNYLVEDFI